MKHSILTSLVIVALLGASQASAVKPKEMNLRQTIDNGSMNKVSAARLRGMLAGEHAQQQMNQTGNDCQTQIGSLEDDGSLLGDKQDIIIIGDIINCLIK